MNTDAPPPLVCHMQSGRNFWRKHCKDFALYKGGPAGSGTVVSINAGSKYFVGERVPNCSPSEQKCLYLICWQIWFPH